MSFTFSLPHFRPLSLALLVVTLAAPAALAQPTTVTFLADDSITESNGTLTFTLEIDDVAPAGGLEFFVSTVDVTATDGADYTGLAPLTSFVIAEGDTTVDVDVPAIEDALDEEDSETFLVQLDVASLPAGITTVTDGEVTGTIDDDDAPPALDVDAGAVDEGNGTLTVDVTLDAPSGRTVSVTIATAEATTGDIALDTLDFIGKSETLTFLPGETTASFVVDIVDDDIDEPTEVFDMALSAPVNASIADGTANADITDNDATPTLSASPLSVSESAGTVQFAIQLSRESAFTVEVTVDTDQVAGEATNNVDFTVVNDTVLTFTPGTTSIDFAVPILADNIDEDDEDFELQLNRTNSDAASNGVVDVVETVTILDDDDTPVLSIATTRQPTEDANNPNDNADFTITLSNPSENVITVDADNVDGTAVAPGDYDVTSVTVTFAAGDTSEVVSVDTEGDTLDEDAETFSLQLSNVSATGALGAVTSATATITDDDDEPDLAIANVNVAENVTGGVLTFTLTLNAASGRTVSVTASTQSGTATAGADFDAITGQVVTFAPGETSKTVEVTLIGDPNDEINEAFTLQLSAPVNLDLPVTSATGTINDDDPEPTVSVSGGTVVEGNAGTATLSYTVSVSVPSGKTVQVTATTSDGTARQPADYTSKSQQLTFAPGTASLTFTVNVNGDGTFEGDDTVNVTLTAPSNATLGTAVASGVITNDDPVPTINVADAVLAVEGNVGVRNLLFTVSLSNPSDSLITFDFATEDGTALAGSDYSQRDDTLIIAAGALTQTVNIVVAGDTLDELDETLHLRLTAATGATIGDDDGLGTITDDDLTPTLAVVSPAAPLETDTGAPVMRFDVVLSAASGQEVRVDIATADDTGAGAAAATAGTDYVAVPTTQLVFPPGTTVVPVNVTVVADALDEEDTETFKLPLSAPVNAALAAGNAAIGNGAIRDDDPTPTLVVADVTLNPEGNVGFEPAAFVVTLSAPSGRVVQFNFATQDGDAVAPADYIAQSGTRQIAPGSVTDTIVVDVVRETAEEGDEVFTLQLSAAVNATLLDATGACLILNDDEGPTTGEDGPFNVDEEGTLTVPADGVLANDDDQDGDALVAVLIDAPDAALEGAFALGLDGSFTFTPVLDFAGPVTFSYVASDGTNDSAPRVVTINVANVNDSPLLDLTPFEVSQQEDDPDPAGALVDELAFDRIDDVDIPFGDLPGIAIVDVPDPDTEGVLEFSLDDGTNWTPIAAASEQAARLIPADGLVRLISPLDAFPTVDVTYRAWDGSDGAAGGASAPVTSGATSAFSATTGTLRFIVDAVNDAPFFVAPTPAPGEVQAGTEGSALVIAVGADDVDDADSALTFTIDQLSSTLPASAVFDDGSGSGGATLTIDASFDHAGAYRARFVVEDAAGARDERDVDITIVFIDGDGDLLPDTWEALFGLNPDEVDSDGDFISDFDEAFDGAQPPVANLGEPVDTDGDGERDALDDDADDDGVLDRDEAGDTRLDTVPITSDGDDSEDFRDDNADDDALVDFDDNCRTVPNDDQADLEGDGIGDACDPDGDGDRLDDALEPELGLSDEDADADDDGIVDGDEVVDASAPRDSDGDGTLDAFEVDSDGDDIGDAEEAGDDEPGTLPVDTDDDGLPDFQDTDSDDDDVLDDVDNCRITVNTDQTDLDGDGVGDACFQVCGDGRVQAPEECEDGDADGEPDDLCDDACQRVCIPEICDGFDQDCDGEIDVVTSPGGGRQSVCETDDISVAGGGILAGCDCSSTAPNGTLPLLALASLGLLALRRRRRRHALLRAAPLLLALSAASAQAAPGDGMQVQQFLPAPGGSEDLVLVEGTGVNGHLRPAAGVFLDYGYGMLNVSDARTGADVALLEHRLGLAAVASISLVERAQIGLQLPLSAFQAQGVDDVFIPAPLAPVALGDVRASGKFSIFDDARRGGPGLAVAAAVTAPTGDPAQLQGYGFLTVEPRVIAGWRFGSRARALVNVGYLLRPRQQLLGFAVANELTWNVGGAFGAVPKVVDVVVEANGRVAADPGIAISATTSPLEALAAARWHLFPGHDITGGVGLGITSGYGTPLFRVLLGYTFTLPGDGSGGGAGDLVDAPNDPDGDTVLASLDQCPDIAEDRDGIQDDDGCPDVDADADNLPDNVDQCPEVAEDADGFEDGDGCADLDHDGDGLAEVDDKCPTVPEDRDGFEDTDGCPDDDNDKDGFADKLDKCPNDAGTVEGCVTIAAAPTAPATNPTTTTPTPDAPTTTTTPAAPLIELPQRIYFQTNGTVVTTEGRRFLEQIAETMKRNENVRVEVQGHSDAQGGNKVNDSLSLRRAQAVIDILVTLGVPRQRFLIAVLSDNEPLAPNDTPQGRALNRRVQFRVLSPGT